MNLIDYSVTLVGGVAGIILISSLMRWWFDLRILNRYDKMLIALEEQTLLLKHIAFERRKP